jgi:hypothetical protein
MAASSGCELGGMITSGYILNKIISKDTRRINICRHGNI